MTDSAITRYFVQQLNNRSHKITDKADYSVQVLDDDDLPVVVAFVGRDSNEILGFSYPQSDIATTPEIPLAVIEAARRCSVGNGQYVNERGEIVDPLI